MLWLGTVRHQTINWYPILTLMYDILCHPKAAMSYLCPRFIGFYPDSNSCTCEVYTCKRLVVKQEL